MLVKNYFPYCILDIPLIEFIQPRPKFSKFKFYMKILPGNTVVICLMLIGCWLR